MTRNAIFGLFCLILTAGATVAPAQVSDDLIAQAEAGDPGAQSELAFVYHEGQGVTQNFEVAATWAARAAEAGDAKAQNLLGRYYHSGLGVAKDQVQAVRWLTTAAAGGDPQFLYDLGNVLENGADGTSDPAAAAETYARAAEAGHVDAGVSLGLLYQEGRGVPQDYARALSLYKAPAAAGHARAQNNLGLLYVRGHGVPQDYERAADLFEAAAQQGFALAMRNLGVMYENGFGRPLDEARAAALYRQAGQDDADPGLVYDPRLTPPPATQEELDAMRQMAQAGDPVAQFQMAWLLASREAAPFESQVAAARLFRAAAEAGHGPSMINLGMMYFQGRGVPQDYVLGRMWLTLAGSTGQPDATALSMHFGSRMTPEQVHEAQALAEARAQGDP